MAPKDLENLIEKYLAGNCTEKERDLVDTWYASLGTNADHAKVDAPEKMASAGMRIGSMLSEHARSHGASENKHRLFFRYYSGIAASLLISIAVAYYLLTPGHSNPSAAQPGVKAEFSVVENITQNTKRVILPDGSIVVMSPDSKIRFLSGVDSSSREVFLEGEAYFDVAHDMERPFYVYAGDVVTRVVGTSFVVRHRGDKEKITVSVKTGKVTVYSRKASHKKTVLTPNQEATYDQATDLVATQRVPVERQVEAQKNVAEMHFEETPVSEALSLLTRTYDIDIVFEDDKLSGCVITSSFFEEGLYDRIDVICTAIGATYRIVDAQIVIDSKGCNLKSNYEIYE